MIRRMLKIVAAPVVILFAMILGRVITDTAETVVSEMVVQRRLKNHARFEGTWTPQEIRLAKAGRELAKFDEARNNHARVEGAPLVTVHGERGRIA